MTGEDRIALLIRQYADGTISRSDYDELMSYVQNTGNEPDLSEAMDRIWDEQEPNDTASGPHFDVRERVYKTIIHSREFEHGSGRLPSLKGWYITGTAALITLALSFTFYWYINRGTDSQVPEVARTGRPETMRATLTLADGRTIDLGAAPDGIVADQNGISVRKTKDGVLVYQVSDAARSPDGRARNTVNTATGGQYQLVLPDGSRVFLNTASSLEFPVQFEDDERTVVLNGEGYFEVTKRDVMTGQNGRQVKKRLPFIVRTGRQQVEVLGTQFNVQGYKDDRVTTTTLLEGAVRVVALGKDRSAAGNRPVVLSPGQSASLTGNTLQVKKADAEQALAWKNGLFTFHSQDLESIMSEISRWYNVKAEFRDDRLKTAVFSGSFSRSDDLETVLQVLQTTGAGRFKLEGKKVLVW
ncbi:DUF4974 domain-containing protein [Pedobacter sp. HMF7647]|uniref:DUF4974 domain-containing protein n=1 Tax=Hufsiella arboris TaxID=2695275 RepID=A0A7K1Y8D1_9SPHI|nr:FecR domain-containing protein [Hufsiella arboris]MXV50308.1 DUF4974 domain-containing protein [Hufsiella arboris]